MDSMGNGRVQNHMLQKSPQASLRNKDSRSNSNLKSRDIDKKPHTYV